jgi:hypothetical protein
MEIGNFHDPSTLPSPRPRRVPTKRPAPSGWGSALVYLVVLCVLVAGAVAAAVVGLRFSMRNAQRSFHNQMVGDAIRQFQIVCQENPNAIELSMRAGVVAETCLIAKDAENYRVWKQLSDTLQNSAGKLSDAQVRKLIEPFSKLKLQ